MQDLNTSERLDWERTTLWRACDGDRTAFAEIYRAYAGLLFSRVLLPLLGQRPAAEDALSETFRQAFERLDSFEPRGSSIYFWLARIATNKALDMHRAQKVSGRVLVNVQALVEPLLDSPLAPDAALDCKRQFIAAEGQVARCLEQLNPRYREAIELRFFQELSREVCAERLELKLGTFDVLLLRALRAFRKRWDELTTGSADADVT